MKPVVPPIAQPCDQPAEEPANRWPAAGLAWAIGVVFALCLYRTGRRLGFDSYYYCELAKTYAIAWPHAFGNQWPCGYPLLGGLLGRLGLSAYPALTLVSLTALAALTAIAAGLAPSKFLVCALAAMPIIGVQIFGAATELPFAAALLGLAAALAAWPKPPAIWAAAGLAVLALSLRYAGVIAFGVVGIWLVSNIRTLRASGRLVHAILAAASAVLVAAGFLLWNLLVLGHLSGADRGAQEGLGWHALPGHLADLGWSLPSALMLGGLRDRIDAGWLVHGIGWGISFSGAIFCGWALLRPRHRWVRSCALVAFTYGIGMAILRSIGSFDALYNARTFLPMIFPLGLVLAGQLCSRLSWVVPGVAGILLASGIASAGRGLSQQIGGDVKPAISILRGRLHRDDIVQVNDLALSLTAFIPQRTDRVWSEYWRQDRLERFLVVAARPVDRSGTPSPVEPAWLNLCDRLVAQGTHRWLLRAPGLLVLERIGPEPTRGG